MCINTYTCLYVYSSTQNWWFDEEVVRAPDTRQDPSYDRVDIDTCVYVAAGVRAELLIWDDPPIALQ